MFVLEISNNAALHMQFPIHYHLFVMELMRYQCTPSIMSFLGGLNTWINLNGVIVN